MSFWSTHCDTKFEITMQLLVIFTLNSNKNMSFWSTPGDRKVIIWKYSLILEYLLYNNLWSITTHYHAQITNTNSDSIGTVVSYEAVRITDKIMNIEFKLALTYLAVTFAHMP